jgi:hypothetical protein
MGRQPTPDDLVVPLPPEHATRRREGRLLEGIRNRSYCFKQFRDDLNRLGFRHRRGHDVRRTMAFAQPRGRRPKGHPRALHAHPSQERLVDRRLRDVPVEALCREVEKLVVKRHEPEHRAQMRCGGDVRARRWGRGPAPAGASPRASRRCSRSRSFTRLLRRSRVGKPSDFAGPGPRPAICHWRLVGFSRPGPRTPAKGQIP